MKRACELHAALFCCVEMGVAERAAIVRFLLKFLILSAIGFG